MYVTNSENLSNEEVFRLTGTLPPERIESLLDVSDIANDAAGICNLIHDGKVFSNHYDEEFRHIQSALNVLKKSTRGENRKEVEALIEYVESFESSLNDNLDFSLDQLQQAETAIRKYED